MFFISVLIAIILTEAITEIVVKSEIFYPVRRFLFNHSYNSIFHFLHSLLDCGYCFSVWAGVFSIVLIFFTENIIINFFILSIVVHRLSNMLHFIIDRLRG